MNIQSMDKKERILETTTKIIAEEGIYGSPMSQIAKKADVAVGTIYHHFESKEQIINEIYLNIKKNFGAVIAESKAKKLGFREEFDSVWMGFYNYFVAHPIQFKFVEQIEHSPIITDEINEECEKYLLPVFEFYQKGINDGVLMDMDLMLMGSLTYDNIMTMVRLNLKGDIVTDKTLKQAVDFSWRGIAK